MEKESLHEELGPLAIPVLQGVIQSQAEKIPVQERFQFTEGDGPRMIITDTLTGKTCTVGLCDYFGARKVLRDLFGPEL